MVEVEGKVCVYSERRKHLLNINATGFVLQRKRWIWRGCEVKAVSLIRHTFRQQDRTTRDRGVYRASHCGCATQFKARLQQVDYLCFHILVTRGFLATWRGG
jgi:hypothetical protein